MNFLKKLHNRPKTLISKENVFSLLLILVIFLLDRSSKLYVLNNFSENVYYINDFLNFDLIWNTGIGFGLLSSKSNLIYNGITLFIGCIISLIFYIALKSDRKEKMIFLIIIGGALGNFYDRIIYKAVPDFVDFHLGNFHWFTFNVADIFITIGIIFYIMSGLVRGKHE